MGFTRAMSVDKLPVGSIMGVEVYGKEILLSNVDNKYYAIGNICTHAKCKLSSGRLQEENITCPCHGSTFSAKTGKVVNGPAKNPEPAYETKVEGMDILISV